MILADEPVSMVDASLRAAILESLLKLHQEQGISILYITHDLNTAYQVGDNILVLYRGSVVEAGGVESVIQYPQHPYTQLLVNSIPAPSTDTRWRDDDLAVKAGDPALADASSGGCAFASRCPHAMPQCADAPPPFFMARDDHGAACYLYGHMAKTTGRQLSAMYPQEDEAAVSTA